MAEIEGLQPELEKLQNDLALQHERDLGSLRKREMNDALNQLRDQVEEQQRAWEDERVRGESEVRELRSERDLVQDRLNDVTAELQCLQERAAALRSVQTPSA